MTVRIHLILNKIKSSFWFIPSFMALMGIALGYGLQELDVILYKDLQWQLTDPSGARAILTTVASSAITVAGLVFSITMVVLSTASTQYGPRLMRTFTRHRNTKIVLGGYIAIFIYCIMVTSTIQDSEHSWIPQISVTVGGVLGLLSFALLIAFIHHVTSFLQASEIINNVSEQIRSSSSNIFPQNAFSKDEKYSLKIGTIPKIEGSPITIYSTKEGYIQAISLSSLLQKTVKHNAMIKTYHKPGEYIITGQPIATLWKEEEEKNWENYEENINAIFLVGINRTEDQDLEYSFDQLVEVAVRAMSKGINDPFTALNSIHKISGALNLIVKKGIPGGMIHDSEGKLRIASKTYTYKGLLNAAFNQIRQNAREIEAVSIGLMKELGTLSRVSEVSEFQLAIKKHADLLLEDASKSFMNDQDLDDLKEAYNLVFSDDKDEE